MNWHTADCDAIQNLQTPSSDAEVTVSVVATMPDHTPTNLTNWCRYKSGFLISSSLPIPLSPIGMLARVPSFTQCFSLLPYDSVARISLSGDDVVTDNSVYHCRSDVFARTSGRTQATRFSLFCIM